MVPLARLERARLATTDFESVASTIPPQGHCDAGGLAALAALFKQVGSEIPVERNMGQARHALVLGAKGTNLKHRAAGGIAP